MTVANESCADWNITGIYSLFLPVNKNTKLLYIQSNVHVDNRYRTSHCCLNSYQGGFGRWTSNHCRLVSKPGERPVMCSCSQPAHFGLLFVSEFVPKTK